MSLRLRVASTRGARKGVARVVPVSALVVLSRLAGADPCAPHAELDGDATLIAQVSTELARLGVERGQAAPGCRGVFAQIESDRDGIAVAIRDGAKRSEGRVVSDPAIAASWIDSWLHDDLDGNAWLMAAPVRVAQTSSEPVRIAPEPHDGVTTTSLLDRVALVAAYEHAWTDGTTTTGISAGGCVQIGRVCLGARVHYARESDRTIELTAMGRSDVSALATASVPFRAGRMSIGPELGIGVGRISTRRIDGCKPDMNVPPPNCDPNDPACNVMPGPTCTDPTGKLYVGDNFSNATVAPRLAAGIRIAVPLLDRVWLDANASAVWAPLGHGASFPGMASNPDGTMPGAINEQFALPGEPSTALQIGIGIRVGAP